MNEISSALFYPFTQNSMIWISSIALVVIVIGLFTLGFIKANVTKGLVIPVIIAGFFLSIGFFLSWIVENKVYSNFGDKNDVIFTAAISTSLGLFVIVVAAAFFALQKQPQTADQ